MKRSLFLILAAAICILFMLCKSKSKPSGGSIITKKDTVVMLAGINSKGIGRFRNIQLTHPLDEKMVNRGSVIYQTKCFACHKLTNETLVGPGWSGVTDRRQPEWILNWITNTKVMLEKDLAAQTELVVCLIRMPNQDLTDQQARDVLEFMRSNDGKK